jgi:hypothetical protein
VDGWHSFDPKDASTYPKVDAPLQVRLNNGSQVEGEFKQLFQPSQAVRIIGWRYIKEKAIR